VGDEHDAAVSYPAQAMSDDERNEDNDLRERASLLSGRVPTTEWTLFVDLGSDSPEGRAAIQTICRRYWYPVYCFVRRRFGEGEADDHTQSFFTQLLETDALSKLEPGKGRFRNWLLASVVNHVRDAHRHANRAKRGGGRVLSFDLREANERYAEDVDPAQSPEKALEAGFVAQLMRDAAERLGASYSKSSGVEKWEAFSPFLLAAPAKGELKPLAERFNMRPRAVSQAIYVLGKRYEAYCEAELRELGSLDPKAELRELAGLI
jgi:RNA polymerase sigma-70 factor (ECF subfamily)